ncbi:hypothetical protein HY493_02490 [Candidatus Woesearchaeota archaeon]|nr:hypothetical protein [Candidatus Woesearchaeota archaeon]
MIATQAPGESEHPAQANDQEERLRGEFVQFVLATGQMHSRYTAEALWESTSPDERMMYIDHVRVKCDDRKPAEAPRPSVLDTLTERIGKLTVNNGIDTLLTKNEKVACLSFGERVWYHALQATDSMRLGKKGGKAEKYVAKMEPEISFRYTMDTIGLYQRSNEEVGRDLETSHAQQGAARLRRNEITKRIIDQKEEYDSLERFCQTSEISKRREIAKHADGVFDYAFLRELNDGKVDDVEPAQQKMEGLLDEINADWLLFQLEDQTYRSWKCTVQAYERVSRRLKVDQRYLEAFCKRTKTEANVDVLKRALDFLQKYEGFVAGISRLSRTYDSFNVSVGQSGLNPGYLTGIASQVHGKDVADRLKSLYGQNRRSATDIMQMVKKRICED